MCDLLGNKSNSLMLDEIAERCEGYLVKDFEILLSLASHECMKRDSQTLNDIDFYNAIDKYVPLNLRNVKKTKTEFYDWETIGGYNKYYFRDEKSKRDFN